jgi:hypothetical protein
MIQISDFARVDSLSVSKQVEGIDLSSARKRIAK